MRRMIGVVLIAATAAVSACTTTVAVRPPRAGMVLVDGRWVVPPRANAVWVAGHWERRAFHRVWVPSHWR